MHVADANSTALWGHGRPNPWHCHTFSDGAFADSKTLQQSGALPLPIPKTVPISKHDDLWKCEEYNILGLQSAESLTLSHIFGRGVCGFVKQYSILAPCLSQSLGLSHAPTTMICGCVNSTALWGHGWPNPWHCHTFSDAAFANSQTVQQSGTMPVPILWTVPTFQAR